ncbi:MFS transporter [Luteolibacter yonseiensis]|uniref:MFS transporter n=1 Tax=Luteolibacter yonseiensis TaxID=1144680 RepID=A0A934R2V5_9BACT|nr:MFS transporter [Luteolibacter yonseiensis]MBK1815447.1 MFS transporter [Luteolibacter yonseiensis]
MNPTPHSTQEIQHLRDLSPEQRRSGLAAWLGWLFDGLDMHLYTLVATAFVAQLLVTGESDPEVGKKASIIQAAFLVGWALGGGFFGRVADLIGRSRALVLTILTYACFTGLSYFSTEWWHLLVFRFLAALGIGGEWAVGASLLSETWPKRWRPWIAATLQSAVNCGILLACLAGALLKGHPPQWIFLVGVLPAFITLWIRRAVPETEEWSEARKDLPAPRIRELFGPEVRSVTWRVMLICAVSLTAHWTFMFWQQSYIRSLPEVGTAKAAKDGATVMALLWIMVGSLVGNFVAGALAVKMGYGRAIALMLGGYFVVMWYTFSGTHGLSVTYALFAVIGLMQGCFGLFTMCLPPLFPVLLRSTGAGFCYNIGRILSAVGVVFFGIFNKVQGDFAGVLLTASWLFIPAAAFALMLPSQVEER